MSAIAVDGLESDAAARARERRTPNRWLILALVCIAQFMVVLDATIVNVALPSIQHGLHFSQASLQWVINGYTLLFGGFLLLGGRAADLFGRRRLFMAGLAVFSIASVINGLAGSASVLVAGRALQGLGAALVSPAALSVVTTTFAEGSERTKALGVWSAIAAGGGAFGLLLGGVLTDALSWQWIFFVNAPIGAIAFALAYRYLSDTRSEAARGIDVGGAVSVTGGLVVLVFAIVKAQAWGWGSARTVALGALAVGLLAAFVAIERRSKAPLIRLDIFRTSSLTIADGVMLLVISGLYAMFFFASLYAQEILGYSPLKAGLAFLPLTAGIIVGAGAAQQLIKRVGVRAVSLIGIPLAAAGLLLMSRVPVAGSYAADLLPALVVTAIGMGLSFVPLTLIATTNVRANDAGLASGLLNTAQQIGGALGLAVLSTLAADRTGNVLGGLGHPPTAGDRATALVDGFHTAFIAGAGLMAAGALVIALLLRARHVVAINADEPVMVQA
jgi:EmrB/QacA subfamily drug resistance transporter